LGEYISPFSKYVDGNRRIVLLLTKWFSNGGMGMGYLNIVLVVATGLLMIIVAFAARKNINKQKILNRRFIEEEDAANAVRKKDIKPELFYEPDLTVLPPIPENDPHKVERSRKRTMIRFTEPITNLELKKQYGIAQMDVIAQYEENFNDYLKALTAWAGELIENDDLQNASIILEEAMNLGSEFRNTYKFAADIHVRKKDEIALQSLRFKVTANHFKDPAIRQHVVAYIDSKLSSEW